MQLSFFELLEESRDLTTKAKMVYWLLCFAEAEGHEVVDQATMAKDLGLSPDSVNRGLKELREHSLVTWITRGLTLPNIYRVVRPGSVQETHRPSEEQQS